MKTASILSATKCTDIYLVLEGDTEPRRELQDLAQLRGAMRLISALARCKLRVLVAVMPSGA